MSWWQAAIAAVSLWLIELANRLKEKPPAELAPGPAPDHEGQMLDEIAKARAKKFGAAS